jgi:hypothetical protein
MAEYKDHVNHHRPCRALAQAAPLRAIPEHRQTDPPASAATTGLVASSMNTGRA